MPTHCRHEAKDYSLPTDKNQQASGDRITTQTDGYTHVIDPSYAPEKHFEPWNLSDVLKNRKSSSNKEKLNATSCTEPTNAPYFSRNYGWDEIEQAEDDEKRLRQLLSIWDAERIAILKLQHDLDKNVLKRTFDYVKRIGQSIGLALWLWVHRPANCSNISSLYQHQQSVSPIITMCNSQNALNSSCKDTRNDHFHENDDDQGRQQLSLSPLDTLPNSMWLKHFVLDESQESLPPIARAMKNMLDNDMLVWNSDIQDETAWPHFINQYRMTQNKTFLRNLHGNGRRQASPPQKLSSSSKYASDTRKTSIKTIDTRSPTKINRPSIQNKRIPSSTYRTSSLSEKHKQKLKKKDQSKTKNKKIKASKKSRRSKSKSRKSRSLSKSKRRNSRSRSKSKSRTSRRSSKSKAQKPSSRSKSKSRKSRSRSKSKRRNTRSRSKSKSRRSTHRSKSKKPKSRSRSKSKGRKSSRRSNSKKKTKHITARTIR